MGKLKVTQVRSTNRIKERQIRTIEALGLKRIRHSVTHEDTPQIRGMLKRVEHLVDIESLEE